MEMAEQQIPENNNLKIKEPLPIIQKIDQNGGTPTLPPLLKVKKLSEKGILPSRASLLSAGYDLSSAHDTEVPARGKALIRTDLSIAIPKGTYAHIVPCWELAWMNFIHVGAGVVDADYRGQVNVLLFNHSDVDFNVNAGDRIAQLIIPMIMTSESRASCMETAEQQIPENNNLKIKEPLPMIQKIDQNGGSPTLPPLHNVKKLSEKAILPSRASLFSAGYDLSSTHDTEVPARGKAWIRTDLSFAIPEGTYPCIAPRSGLAWKNFIHVGAGVIDADYQGQVDVILFNHSDVDFKVNAGDRIAQLIIQMTPEIDQNGGSPTHPLLEVQKLSEKVILPSRASLLSAAYDLSSAHDTEVPARGKALIQTDLSIVVPEGTYACIAPCWELAWKNFIGVGGSFVDGDYRGQVNVILFNHSDVDFKVNAGDRIAQLIIETVMTPEVLEVEELDSTVGGEGGFGSTGV